MRDYQNARAIAGWESSWLEPPCPRPEWVVCAQCGQELLDEDAEWDNRDNPYCSPECLDEGPYDADEELWITRFGEDEE